MWRKEGSKLTYIYRKIYARNRIIYSERKLLQVEFPAVRINDMVENVIA